MAFDYELNLEKLYDLAKGAEGDPRALVKDIARHFGLETLAVVGEYTDAGMDFAELPPDLESKAIESCVHMKRANGLWIERCVKPLESIVGEWCRRRGGYMIRVFDGYDSAYACVVKRKE